MTAMSYFLRPTVRICSRCPTFYRLHGAADAKYPSVALQELLQGVEDIPDSNPPRPAVLKNKYYGLRHGESTANIAGIISSDPVLGTLS